VVAVRLTEDDATACPAKNPAVISTSPRSTRTSEGERDRRSPPVVVLTAR
jgi:hypothetical protein